MDDSDWIAGWLWLGTIHHFQTLLLSVQLLVSVCRHKTYDYHGVAIIF